MKLLSVPAPGATRRALVLTAVLLLAVAVAFAVPLVADLTVGAPPGVTSVADPSGQHLGEVATNGSDRSIVVDDGSHWLVCDEEADGNLVRGIAEVTDDAGERRVRVEDRGGADGRCTSVPVDGVVRTHQVCERNHLIWVCGNAQTGR